MGLMNPNPYNLVPLETPDNLWRQKTRERRRDETKRIKKALNAAGFKDVSVGHGRGTSWSWIEATIHEPYTRERNDLAESIVLKVSGREELKKRDDILTDYVVSNVCVDFRPKIKKL